MLEKQKAKDLAELWLKDEHCRDPDKLMNEQRMAAFLLLALAEIEELQQYMEHHEFVIDQLQTALENIAASTGCTCTNEYECMACRLREDARMALESDE
jgi:hypothetical protein